MPGLALSRFLFEESVQPLMARYAPGLPYAAGLFGAGSDVLGYDTERSTDHDWGPRLFLFLRDEDLDKWPPRLDEMFRAHLPREIAGFETGSIESIAEPGVTDMASGEGTFHHRIVIATAAAFLQSRVGIDDTTNLTPTLWLTMPEQSILEVTSGAIFHDGIGDISRMRADLAWYPDDVWRYRMAAQWQRIDQLEPFIGRCGEVGDDLGSQLVAITLVRDVMRLAFLMERRYVPYPKWFGTAFGRLAVTSALLPHLDRARYAMAWPDREAGVIGAMVALANHHNDLGLTAWIDPAPRAFHTRPFTIIGGARFSEALLATVTDPAVRALPRHIGGLDQYIDSTDALNASGLHRAIREWMRDSGP